MSLPHEGDDRGQEIEEEPASKKREKDKSKQMHRHPLTPNVTSAFSWKFPSIMLPGQLVNQEARAQATSEQVWRGRPRPRKASALVRLLLQRDTCSEIP